MKKLMFVCVCGLFVSSIASASLIDWASTQLSNDPEVGASLQDGWLVRMYVDTSKDNTGSWYNDLRLDGTGGVTSTGLTSDDQFIGEFGELDYFIAWVQLNPKTNINVADNSHVYSVIFNAATIGSATQFVVADSSPFDVGVHDPAIAYDLGSSIAGDYQAIPEPTVMALIGVFGGGLMVVRRFFSMG